MAVEILVEGRADVNLAKGPMKLSPLAVLASRGQASPATVQRLLELRAEPNPKNSPFLTLANLYDGHLYAPEMADLLVSAKADVNRLSDMSALFTAVSRCSRAYCCVAKDPPWAIEFFSNLRGMTPLHSAVASGAPELVEFLLANRADPKAKNVRGKTALDFSRTAEMHLLVESLIQGNHLVGQWSTCLSVLKAETVEVSF